MTPIAKGFVLRVATSAKRYTRVFPNEAAAWSCNPNLTSDVQWTIRPRIDRCFFRLRFLGAIIKPLEVQRPGRAGHDHFGDLIRASCIDLDPWSALGLEDFRQTSKAVTSVNTQLWLPGDSDLAIAIDSFHARLFALFVFVV